MKYLLPRLRSMIKVLHPRTLALNHQGLTDEDLSQDHNTWFV
jgi:hypothetical protein